VRAVGGLLSTEDLARHHSDWVEPISIDYRGVTVYELPPSSQGIVALIILNILNHLPEEPIRGGGADYIHLLAEAARLAYADRARYLTDPLHMTVEARALLSDRYAADRACLISQEATAVAMAGTPGDTIYLCTADGEGNLVSLIESNFMGIGSGVMAGETGVMLQNRGHWFSLDPDHANVIAPGKRTLHTLMPGIAFKGDRPWLVFGSMGGSAQAQIHVELLTRKIDQALPVDQTIAAPRFDAVVGINDKGYPLIQMENRFPPEVIGGLQRSGHCVQLLGPHAGVGHAHMIEILDNGAYAGAADPRADSLALGY
jgi:gamma-glutamyltranspeptidase/glutathione hydrolase